MMGLAAPALAVAALCLCAPSSPAAWPYGFSGRFGGGYWPTYYGSYFPGYYGSYYSYRPGYYGGMYSFAPSYYTGYYGTPYTPAYTYSWPTGYFNTIDTTVVPTYTYGYPMTSGSYTSAYPAAVSPSAVSPDRCLMDVRVPANAEVWIEGQRMQTRGTNREFQSPPLTPGRAYTYDLRARWTGANGPVDQTKQITVHAGDRVNVDFARP
jgi:uncharacterized protein (TIGR03000 family)